MVPYEGTYIFPSSYTPRFARSLVIHEGAGRLRRKVSGGHSVFQGFREGWLTCRHVLPFRSADINDLGL